MIETTGTTIGGLAAAVEKRKGEFRPVVLDMRGDVVHAGEWRKKISQDQMESRADALLRRKA
jgi:sulfur carrier protein ThiS